ncbi:hypothetical protein F3G58_35205, partial [Pseudomonas aeruginosa]
MPQDKNMPVALHSIFGYVIAGQVSISGHRTVDTENHHNKSNNTKSFVALSVNLEQETQSVSEKESILIN